MAGTSKTVPRFFLDKDQEVLYDELYRQVFLYFAMSHRYNQNQDPCVPISPQWRIRIHHRRIRYISLDPDPYPKIYVS